MTDIATIKTALAACANEGVAFDTAASELFAAMGYESRRTLRRSQSAARLVNKPAAQQTRAEKSFCEQVEQVHGLFQYTESELIDGSGEVFEQGNINSFLFFAVELKPGSYSRGSYAEWTRVINRKYAVPTVVLFYTTIIGGGGGVKATLAFVGRRPHRLDSSRSVLEAVSLLREIDAADPHRGHLDILESLVLSQRRDWIRDKKRELNFDSLLAAWLYELNTDALNDRFYDELEQWFEIAVENMTFPLPPPLKQGEQVIRLINRILFIWFIKEKGLIAKQLFNRTDIAACLKDGITDEGDNYYRAILQNLFFATLNTEITKRRFSKANRDDHRNPALYRYRDLIANEKQLLEYFSQSPFVNGGLFECLDDFASVSEGGQRIDCFSDNLKHRKWLFVPNWLFFGNGGHQGLFDILRKYKFTVEENTPIEQEVALDPELLGKVYERLLGYLNRKESGAYYTPRPVVDYMVREALTAYFAGKMSGAENIEKRLSWLLSAEIDYDLLDESDKLTVAEVENFIAATSELRLLDPAVGSGAFPMGVLTQLTMALMRIDPKNRVLYKREKRHAESFEVRQIREEALIIVEKSFAAENRYNNYARKLTIIRDCLFGVDISTAAMQVCRLRFFISLAIEQKIDNDIAGNYGIQALPNLEARIIAADTLIKIQSPGLFHDEQVQKLEKDLRGIRQQFFSAKTREEKLNYMESDEKKRLELKNYLETLKDVPAEYAERIAEWNLYDQTKSADWFDAELMFGITTGFDVIIGNPPYIQLEINRGYLRHKYTPYSYQVIGGRGDIYHLFYERGYGLLKNGGHLVYITSNSYMQANAGKKLRKFLRAKTAIKMTIDFGEMPVFEAGTQPAILLLENRPANADAKIRVAIVENAADIATIDKVMETSGFFLKAINLSDDGWILASDIFSFIEKIKRCGIPLDRYIGGSLYCGIKTGLDDAFIIDKSIRQSLIDEDPNSIGLIKPFLGGGDIERWRTLPSEKYVIFTTPSTDIDRYPAIKEHLSKYIGELKGRAWPPSDYWYALQQIPATNYVHFTQPKIMYSTLSLEFRSCIDDKGLYMAMSVFFIFSDKQEYLIGILNSELMDFYYRHTFPSIGDPWNPITRGRIKFPRYGMQSVPIIEAEESEQEQIADIVRQISSDPQGPKVSQLSAEIDELVYKLYNITEDEKAIVKEWQAKRRGG